jgi:1-acyl-sn-glycerol-3-phosphate acyltransferase
MTSATSTATFAQRPDIVRSVPSGAEYEPVQLSLLSHSLQVAPDAKYLVLNAPDGELGGDGAAPAPDVILLFAATRAELDANARAALSAVKSGGALWVAYPNPSRGRSDLNRDHGWGALNAAGFVPTSNVTLDADWEAAHVRPVAEVPSAAIPAADMLPVGRRATPTFRLVRALARPLFHLLFRFDVRGLERIPRRAFVVIANHLGWMDAISLLLLFPPEPRIHFLADPGSMMRNRPLWMLIRLTGGIVPVNRAKHGDSVLFSQVDRCLKAGGAIALFPEGDFGPSEGRLLPFKKGFAYFAVENDVAVLPVGLSGMREVWLGKRLVVRIGEPIPAEGKTVDEMLDAGEKAVASLVPQYVEPTGRKPLRRWLTGLF